MATSTMDDSHDIQYAAIIPKRLKRSSQLELKEVLISMQDGIQSAATIKSDFDKRHTFYMVENAGHFF